MAVAEKPLTEASTGNPLQQFAVGSMLSGAFLLGSIMLVLTGFPTLWYEVTSFNPYLSGAIILVLDTALIFGLIFLGLRLEGSTPPHGQRAGAFVSAVAMFVALWFAVWVSSWLAISRDLGMALGLVIGLILAAGVLVLTFVLMTKPGVVAWLQGLDDQGWFQAAPFKPSQGARVRRCSLVAFLLIGACGVYTAFQQRLFGSGHWTWDLPVSEYEMYLMFNVQVLGPIVMLLIIGWISWRVINVPAFADFLIATEAEINKVSWTTRRRLFQDTIVVLTTVILMALFLFVVDICWVRGLNALRVLQIDTIGARVKQHDTTQW